MEARIAGDIERDQVETTEWYANDYIKYDHFWKKYKRTHVIDTTNLSIEEIFKKIDNILKGLSHNES